MMITFLMAAWVMRLVMILVAGVDEGGGKVMWMIRMMCNSFE